MADGAEATDTALAERGNSTSSIASDAASIPEEDSGRVVGAGFAQVDVSGCSQGISDLFFAAGDGDIDRVKALCMAGEDVDGEYFAVGTSARAAAHYHEFFEEMTALSKCGADTEGASTRVVSTALHAAAYFGHVEIVRFLCEAGAKTGVVDTDGLPALHLAGSPAVAAALLGHGVGVNRCYGISSHTALHAAAERGSTEVVRFLCGAGAEIDRADTKGMTALHLAARHDRGAEVGLALIDYGADLGSAIPDGCTPLHEAAQYGCTELVKSLCTAGAEVDRVNDKGWTPLHLAVLRGDNIATAEALLNFGADVNRSCESKQLMALHIASFRGQADLIRLLCRAGAEVHEPCSTGCTPLHWAMMFSENAASVTALLESGADVNRRAGRVLRTALHLAAFGACAEHALVLCEAGAHVDDVDSDGMTALHHAADREQAEVVQVLLKHGANVNAARPSGATPLHGAVERGNEEITRILCAAGADTDLNSAGGRTPLHAAAMQNFDRVARVLLEYRADKDAEMTDGCTPLFTAVLLRHAAVARVLCSAGANLQAMDMSGCTALHAAARDGSEEMVHILLEHGADVNARDTYRARTPLHFAASSMQAGIVRILCAGGADTAIRSAEERTPLGESALDLEMVAVLCECGADPDLPCDSTTFSTALVQSIFIDSVDVAKVLLQRGARPDICFLNGFTALHFAAILNRHAIVEELLLAGADTEARMDNSRCFTPLHLACQKSQLESVLALLRAGANELAPVEGPPRSRHGEEVALDVRRTIRRVAAVTAIDIVGDGLGLADGDPEQRTEDETDEDFAARRNPERIERIRVALQQATRDRLWGRRCWLVLLRARIERYAGENREEGAAKAIAGSGTGVQHRVDDEARRRRTDDDDDTMSVVLGEGEEENEVDDEESVPGGVVDEMGGVLAKRKKGRVSAEAAEKSLERRDHRLRGSQEGAKLVTEHDVGAATSKIVAPGTDCSEQDASISASVAVRGSCGVVGVETSTVFLHQVLEGLFCLARIEEGTFRHVVRFL